MSAQPDGASTTPDLPESLGDSLGPPIPGPVPDALPPALTARYRLEGEIARGGMGAVLRGHDSVLHRDLAVKVLLEEHCDVPELVRRFFEEAQVGGQLQHPGVAPVHDMGLLPDRRPYFAMKLVEGRTLADLLAERDGPAQDLPRFLKVFEQICQTLAYAHACGVIHRDLKPSNVMVGAFGEVLVMDWGLAKVLHRAAEAGGQDGGRVRTLRDGLDAGRSQPGAVLGTPSYMPPEQARGQVEWLDERCDVFGLGAVLCEILTGKPPYLGRNAVEVHLKAAGADLADAYARLGACGADAELIRIAKGCLSADREDRPRDGRAVAEATAAYLAGVQERLRAAEMERAAAQARALEERKRRRLTVALAATVLAFVVLGAGGGLWVERDQSARREQETRRQAEKARLAREQASEATQALNEAADFRRRGAWKEAAAALARAEGRLGSDGPDELYERLRQARRELKTVADLEEIRLRQLTLKDGKLNDNSGPAAYAEKFQADYGLVLEPNRLGDAAERIAGSPIKEQLAAALDAWAGAEPDRPRREQVLALLRMVDPNPWRDRLWECADRGDGQGLEKLAAEVKLDEVSATFPAVLSAVVLLRNEKSEAALSLLRRAQQRRPDDFWLNTFLGTWMYLARPADKEKAIGYLRAGLALRPDNAVVAFDLGLALQEHGDLDEAMVFLRKATESNPDFLPANLLIGEILIEQHKAKEAEGVFRAILDRHPENATAHLGVGNALVGQDRWADAVAPLTRAVDLGTGGDVAQYSLGLALFQLGRAAEAADHLRETVRLKPDNVEAQYYLGLALMKLDKSAEAADAFSKAVGGKAGHVEVDYFHGLALLKQGKAAEAADEFRKAIETKADYADAHCGLGLALSLQDRHADAADAFRKSLELKPANPEAEDGLGQALLKLNKPADAADAFRAALKLAPDDSGAYCGLGRALTGLDRPTEALEALRKSVALAPDDSVGNYYLGLALIQQNQASEALGPLGKAVAKDADNAEAHFYLGYALYQLERLGAALVHFRKAVALQPDYAEAHVLLGMTLMNQGRFTAGLASLRRGDELGSRKADWSLPSALLLRVRQRLIDLARKLPDYLKGDLKPDGADMKIELAELCLKYDKKLYAAALRLYSEAFADSPKLLEDAEADHRAWAARAAARAGCGEGDAKGADEDQRARWRRQALDWLRDDLAEWRKRLEAETATRDRVREVLNQWKNTPDLAGLRDKDGLEKLPAAERDAWRQFWLDVDAVLAEK